MLKSGFSSQSGGRSLGRFDDFCEGLGCEPGVDGENEEFVEEVDDAGWLVDLESFEFELLPELEEANVCTREIEGESIRYCHPTLTRRRLGLARG